MYSRLAFYFSPKIFPKKLRLLYGIKLIRAIGVEFSVFFLPIYLFTIGQKSHLFPSLTDIQIGMIFIGTYFLLERLSIVCVSWLALQQKITFRIRDGMILSQVIFVGTLTMFLFAQLYPVLLIPIALLEGVKIAFFWPAYYTLFSENAQYKHMGESVGSIEFFIKLVQAAIPALAGLLIVSFGFNAVFLVGLIFQLAAIFLLWALPHQEHFCVPTMVELTNWLKEKSFQQFSYSVIGRYIGDMMQLLWPLFIFLLVGSVEKVGFIYFVVLFLSLLVTYFVGWYVDHTKSLRPFSLSGLAIGLTWIIRMGVVGVWSIIAVDIFDKLAKSIYIPFYESILLRRGKGKTALNYFVYREFILSLGGIVFWCGLIGYFYFSNSWRAILIMGFVAVLMSLQMRERRIEEG